MELRNSYINIVNLGAFVSLWQKKTATKAQRHREAQRGSYTLHPKYRLLFFILNFSFLISYAQLPNTDIWLLDVKDDKGTITFSNPINITNREGYDNQPSFSPDGKYILFTSVREGVQSDIYKYDIASKQTTQFTKTEESEYSPTFMLDRKNISVVSVEKDSTQRLWKFPITGGSPALIMSSIKNIGYHCWINKDSVALFILPEPFTLQIANVNTEKITTVEDSIGRCIQLIPQRDAFSYTTKDSNNVFIHQYNFEARQNKRPASLSMKSFKIDNKSEDYVWYNMNMLIKGAGSELFSANCFNPNWQKLQDLKYFGIEKIGRIAISADRKKIALVCTR